MLFWSCKINAMFYAQRDESLMLNRLLPDGKIIHARLKFDLSGRIQDV